MYIVLSRATTTQKRKKEKNKKKEEERERDSKINKLKQDTKYSNNPK